MAKPDQIPIKWTTRQKLEEACSAIEKQWAHHLVIRAAFPFRILKTRSNKGASYYVSKGIDIDVRLPSTLSPTLQLGVTDVGAWANQNFVIRLFGILDGAGVIEAGIQAKDPFITIVKHLRNNVGAHSAGRRDPSRSEVRLATKLIQKHLDSRVLPKDAESFNLDIMKVLEPLKDGCIAFVRSMIPSTNSP